MSTQATQEGTRALAQKVRAQFPNATYARAHTHTFHHFDCELARAHISFQRMANKRKQMWRERARRTRVQTAHTHSTRTPRTSTCGLSVRRSASTMKRAEMFRALANTGIIYGYMLMMLNIMIRGVPVCVCVCVFGARAFKTHAYAARVLRRSLVVESLCLHSI